MAGQPQSLRGLKALVGIMAVLIIIGTTVVVGTVIHRLYARFSAPPTAPAPSVASSLAPPFDATSAPAPVVQLGANEHIVQMAPIGTDIALLLDTPQGQKLLILNPATGVIKKILTAH